MNPDKLFDYLDGKLPESERSKLEGEIAQDPHLQKEFAAARRIHTNMRAESPDILTEDEAATAKRGRKMALRVGIAFIILMAVNVVGGLWFIAHHEASNPNRKLLETQMRDQITRSLQASTHAALTPPALDLSEMTIAVRPGQLSGMADQVVALVEKLGGTATRELPDPKSTGVLAEVPAQRESEFRAGIDNLNGASQGARASPNGATAGTEKKSFVIHIVENVSP